MEEPIVSAIVGSFKTMLEAELAKLPDLRQEVIATEFSGDENLYQSTVNNFPTSPGQLRDWQELQWLKTKTRAVPPENVEEHIFDQQLG